MPDERPKTDVLDDIYEKLTELSEADDEKSGWLLEKCHAEIVRLRGGGDAVKAEPDKNLKPFCPKADCGAPTFPRERRPDGFDVCERGHTYRSSKAVMKEVQDCTVKLETQEIVIFDPSRRRRGK